MRDIQENTMSRQAVELFGALLCEEDGIMDILFYVEAVIYAILTLFMNVKSKAGYKKEIVAWRLAAALSIGDLVVSVYLKRSVQNSVFVYLLMFQSFVIMPFFSQGSTCGSCGRRVFWKPLISNQCPRCGETINKKH